MPTVEKRDVLRSTIVRVMVFAGSVDIEVDLTRLLGMFQTEAQGTRGPGPGIMLAGYQSSP